MVAHTGFEPVVSSLRGRCPGPLDECAIMPRNRGAGTSIRGAHRPRQPQRAGVAIEPPYRAAKKDVPLHRVSPPPALPNSLLRGLPSDSPAIVRRHLKQHQGDLKKRPSRHYEPPLGARGAPAFRHCEAFDAVAISPCVHPRLRSGSCQPLGLSRDCQVFFGSSQRRSLTAPATPCRPQDGLLTHIFVTTEGSATPPNAPLGAARRSTPRPLRLSVWPSPQVCAERGTPAGGWRGGVTFYRWCRNPPSKRPSVGR